MSFKMLKLLILTLILVISESRSFGNKRQQEVLRLECEPRVVDDPACPIDGGWTSWSPWSACQGSCDQVGHRTRTRDCTNPPRSPGGITCSGPDEQTETCNMINCTVKDFKLLVEGDSGRIEAMRLLETVPALLDQCLTASCTFEAVKTAIYVENTWQQNPENVWYALLCVKYNIGCPVKGEWGVWGVWSPCGARCGQGWKWRLRRCDTPFPSEAQLICSGPPIDTEACYGDQCAIEQRSTIGTWSEWGKWSACPESCGIGVKRRHRNCDENQIPLVSGSWGTLCRGQHDELQECQREQCVLDGGWSGWSDWEPCSRTCGTGQRLRSRSCTRPIPSGSGAPCAGSKTEVGSCYMAPCYIHLHNVALFNGDSFIKYKLDKQSFLTHFFIRFMALSPQGNLIRRGNIYDSYIRLSIWKWHICVHAVNKNKDCSILKICSNEPIEPAVWHTAMITLTSKSMSLRYNDNLLRIQTNVLCEPIMSNSNTYLIVGEKFYGEIQEVIFNFTPLHIRVNEEHGSTKSDLFPVTSSNVGYELANMEEGLMLLDKEFFFRIPCFTNLDDWKLELTVKPKREYGTVIFIMGHKEWLHVSLQNSRLKVKFSIGDYRSQSTSAMECSKDQWLDITITKHLDATSMEILINGVERLHVLLDPDMEGKRRRYRNKCKKSIENLAELKSEFCQKKTELKFCVDEYFVGGVPADVKNKISEIFTPFYGYVASIALNTILYDIHAISQERNKANRTQLTSRTASTSDFYSEIYWYHTDHLNVPCFPNNDLRSPSVIQWMSLDTGLFTIREINALTNRNARELKLNITPGTDVVGFYTCRAFTGTYTHNIITYGVVDNKIIVSKPNILTIAVLCTSGLIVLTLIFLLIEGLNDLRAGHGFFRDHQQTPKQNIVSVDNNQELVGGDSAAELLRVEVEEINLDNSLSEMSETYFAAEEPEDLLQGTQFVDEYMSTGTDLPARPESTSSRVESPRLRSELNYVSTPQHELITPPRKKLTSSFSLDLVTPRVLCSRIITAKRRLSPRESVASNKNKICYTSQGIRKIHPTKKTTMPKIKTAEKILDMFQQLQCDV